MRKKSVLDEREMLELYTIEHHGLWLTLVLLCAVVVVQLLLGASLLQMAGELGVLLIACVALMAAYIRRGIWDDSARPSVRGNAVYSAVAGVGVSAVLMLMGRNVARALLLGAGSGVLCMLVLSALMAYMQHRQRAKEHELEDEE